ncbi:hypothetical protein [Streptosporangium saharense]|uniref:hypothetical protein n=1 Tax=Streptosporangium saharense TaxID=1706840 RepID=UPI003325530D
MLNWAAPRSGSRSAPTAPVRPGRVLWPSEQQGPPLRFQLLNQAGRDFTGTPWMATGKISAIWGTTRGPDRHAVRRPGPGT